MPWIRRRPWLSLFVLAAALRVSLALITERHPIFPAFYYTDARVIDQYAWSVAQTGKMIGASQSERVHAYALAAIYRAFGHEPLLGKLAGALAGAGAIVLLAKALSLEFGLPAAAGFGLLAALWPSSVFFSSQNFKDPWELLFAYGALACAIGVLLGENPRRFTVMGAAFLALTGLLRPYVLGIVGAACLAAGGAAALKRRSRAWACAALVAAGFIGYRAASRTLVAGPLKAPSADPAFSEPIIPVTYDAAKKTEVSPLSPEGIERFRDLRQSSDQAWAARIAHRQIETQIFPNAHFAGWLDLALFTPKAVFYVLFMPLPGLYPLGHKLGRWLSAAENVAALFLACAGLFFAARSRWTPARVLLLSVFFAMALGSGLLEFDLGSAARHKIFYLPLLFPFAVEGLLSLRARRKG